MCLVGILSNHVHNERIQRLSRIVCGLECLPGRTTQQREGGGYLNARPGSVTNAVVEVLDGATGPLSPREVL